MPNRLFAGNSLAAFDRSGITVVEATTAGKFDNTYCASSIFIPAGQYIDTYPFLDAASVTTFYISLTSYGIAGSDRTWLEFFNSTGTLVYRVTMGTTQVSCAYWNGSSMVSMGNVATTVFNSSALRRVMVKIVCGASGSFELFNGGASVASSSGGHASANNIAKARVYSIQGLNGDTWSSEIMGADYDIRNARFMHRLANANGADTDGTGTYTDINETVLDDTTAIALTAVGHKKTFTKTAITVPAGMKIDSMWVNARGRISGAVVADGQLLVRSGGADYASASKAFGAGYSARGHYVANDPATGVPFTETGFNNAEFGAKAV
jgi:hypothetical protein